MIVRKKFTFEAAHRLSKHGGRCAGLHGHSYKVEVVLDGDVSPDTGMVVDFGEVKRAVGCFIDKFDHALILHEDDPAAHPIEEVEELNPRYIITPYQPTAEMMAAHIFQETHMRLASDTVRVEKVRVWETETGWAECGTLLPVAFERTVFSKKLERAE